MSGILQIGPDRLCSGCPFLSFTIIIPGGILVHFLGTNWAHLHSVALLFCIVLRMAQDLMSQLTMGSNDVSNIESFSRNFKTMGKCLINNLAL